MECKLSIQQNTKNELCLFLFKKIFTNYVVQVFTSAMRAHYYEAAIRHCCYLLQVYGVLGIRCGRRMRKTLLISFGTL